jgi:hypothetical protein
MMGTITEWARRTSSFGDSRADFQRSRPDEASAHGGDLIYRLRRWPQLPGTWRTADVLRLLSVLSSRPLRRSWILAHSRLDTRRLDTLVQRLQADGSLEVIDPSALPRERPVR